MLQKEPITQMNRQIADFGLKQPKRALYTPSHASLPDHIGYPFEEDKSVYSCTS